MEAADRAAGDRDEEERQPTRRVGGQFRVHRGRHDLRVHHEHGEADDPERDEQLVSVHVVARLQEQPHGEDRGDEGVGEEDRDPSHAPPICRCRFSRRGRIASRRGELRLGRAEADEVGQREGHVLPEPDEHVQRRQRAQRRNEDPRPRAVDEEPDDERDDERAPHRNHGAGVRHEQVRDDHGEDRVHHQEQEEDDEEEENPCALAEDGFRQRPDRPSLVAGRDPQGAEVVHRPGEDRPEHNPQEGGQPAPDDGDRGSHDGRRSRHRREVVSEEHMLVRGHVVDAVLELVRGRDEVGVELEDLAGDEARVDEDSGQERRETNHQQDDRAHRVTSQQSVSGVD